MLSTAGGNFALSDATLGNGYDLGQASSRNYSGGYYSPDNLHTMLAEAISRATISAAEVSVSYDHSTRSMTFTTTSRGNQSSLKIGRSVASNITLDEASGSATSLIDTAPGTAGFIGALGLSQDAASKGTGSFFEFRLGGEGNIFSIQFGTMGLTNMGADQVDISNLNLSTPGGAASAIASIENALDSISSSQTRIGSGINHMRRRIEIMESQKGALSGSKSRVEEIDFTVESRKLASLQMLLQSSTAALAQANIVPQTLLQLLA